MVNYTFLISWNIAVVVYLILTMKVLWSANHAHILKRAQQQDASKWLIIFLVVITTHVFYCDCD